MLPYVNLDANGRLAGDVIYARDFGVRNALLRQGHGDRSWFVVRTSFADGKRNVALEPVQ